MFFRILVNFIESYKEEPSKNTSFPYFHRNTAFRSRLFFKENFIRKTFFTFPVTNYWKTWLFLISVNSFCQDIYRKVFGETLFMNFQLPLSPWDRWTYMWSFVSVTCRLYEHSFAVPVMKWQSSMLYHISIWSWYYHIGKYVARCTLQKF